MVTVGAVALRVALAAGVVAVAGGIPLLRRSHPRLAPAALAVTTAATLLALAALVEAFWSKDFSVAYVADHARRDVGTATRLSGAWGGMAGSLLCYAAGTSVVGALAAARSPAIRRSAVAATGAAVTASLLGIVVALSDPFRRLEIPAVDGAGLTPILEHAAMLYHPPLVYAGLTSLTGALGLTVAALAARRLDEQWLAQVRRWLLVSWTLLAVAMLAGAHWAYVELGWGGYWAWDPVENTALLPWLAVTAALHGLQPVGSRGRRASGPTAVAGLVGAAFLLSLLGGLLTRSGTTGSVHAFAESGSIGRAFAVLLATAGAGLALLLWRGRRRVAAPRTSPGRAWPPDRHAALVGQQLLVLGALAVVLAGSVWPLLVDLTGGRELVVDGRFFAALCGPLAVAALLLVAVGPSLGRLPPGAVVLPPVLGSAGGVVGAGVAGWRGAFALAVAAVGGAAIVGAGAGLLRRPTPDRSRAPHVAHLGFAVFLLGVAGTTTGGTEVVRLAEGQSTVVEGRTVTNLGVAVVDGPTAGTTAVEATVAVDDHVLRPQLVAHTQRNRLLAESALHSTVAADVQLMLRDAGDDGSVVLEVGVHPLQQLVWWGGLVVVGGGAASLTGRRRRLPAVDAVASRGASPGRPPVPPPAPVRPRGAPGATVPPARA